MRVFNTRKYPHQIRSAPTLSWIVRNRSTTVRAQARDKLKSLDILDPSVGDTAAGVGVESMAFIAQLSAEQVAAA